VFIGARKEQDSDNWNWQNRTRVTEAYYGTAKRNYCQQMSLPLSYEKNQVDLKPMRCDSPTAYFICEA